MELLYSHPRSFAACIADFLVAAGSARLVTFAESTHNSSTCPCVPNPLFTFRLTEDIHLYKVSFIENNYSNSCAPLLRWRLWCCTILQRERRIISRQRHRCVIPRRRSTYARPWQHPTALAGKAILHEGAY